MLPVRLFRHVDIAASGVSPRRLATALRVGTIIKVRPGVYARADEWERVKQEARVVARAHALAMVSSVALVFSHETAAALHGLPLFRADRHRVHTIATADRPGRAGGVIRHRGELITDDLTEIGGLQCTSLERTVADVARTATFEQAVTVADAALRLRCVDRPGQYDADGAVKIRRAAIAISKRSAHGLTRAERVLEFADGRAQLPGESLSRIRLHELGFRTMDLQVRVPGPAGKNYYVDFGLEDENAFGEFDGAMKYVDGKLVDGRTSSEVLDEEKQREDWIRGTTQRRYVRWGWPHISNADALRERLEAFGIRAPR